MKPVNKSVIEWLKEQKIDVMPTNNIRRQAEHPKNDFGILEGRVPTLQTLTRGRGT